jgi:hypothetical protein
VSHARQRSAIVADARYRATGTQSTATKFAPAYHALSRGTAVRLFVVN